MGCCVSTTAKEDPPNPDQRSRPNTCHSPEKPRAPSPKRTHLRARTPPPPVEEETVKEVLSETPLPRKVTSFAERDAGGVARARKLRGDEPETKVLISKLEEVAEIVSEYSEMCSASASLSLSTTTTTATEKRDNEVTSRDSRELRRQRMSSNRSPVKAQRKRQCAEDLAAGGERRGVKSQSRSPARTQVGGLRSTARGVREFSGELKPARQDAGIVGRAAGGEDLRRRQSRSPATRRDNGLNRSGVVRRPTKARERSGVGRALELGTVEDGGKKAEPEETHGGSPELVEESLLDNPNVSLECFIFL